MAFRGGKSEILGLKISDGGILGFREDRGKGVVCSGFP